MNAKVKTLGTAIYVKFWKILHGKFQCGNLLLIKLVKELTKIKTTLMFVILRKLSVKDKLLTILEISVIVLTQGFNFMM